MTKNGNWKTTVLMSLLAVALVLPQGVWAEDHHGDREERERHEEERERHDQERERHEEEREHGGEEHAPGPEHDFYEQIDALAEEAERVFSEEVQEFLGDFLPEALEHIHDMAGQAEEALASPELRRQLYEAKMHLTQMARELSAKREEHPELFERIRQQHRIEMESHMLAEEYRRSESQEERDRIRQELRRLLEEGFALSQEVRELEAERIERELDKVRTMLERRQQNKQIIIDRRMHELLENNDPFEW